MNYTQKRRINQVDEETLVVGIDVSKERNVARAQDFRGIEHGKAIKFLNRTNGFERFKKWAFELMAKEDKEKIIIGLEPTGHYWLPFFKYLTASGFKTVTVNPHHVEKSKELDDNNPTKNDVKDARVIAQLVKDGRYSEPNLPEGKYADLRVAINHRERLNKDLTRIKNRIQRWIDMYFPEFNDVFKSFEGKAALSTLKNIPLPEEVRLREPEEIVALWRKDGIKRGVGIKKARRIKKKSINSVGVETGLELARREIKQLLEQYNLLEEQLEKLEKQIEELLEELPGAKEMLSIPGVGKITVAGFLAECGDLNNYDHPRQIIKLAGLNLKEHSSGKHKGETKITKRGRPKLRALLYRVSLPLVRCNEEFREIHEYYTKRNKNPLKKTQSLIAICCKLIRILYTLGTREIEYDGEKLRNDIKRPKDYERAA